MGGPPGGPPGGPNTSRLASSSSPATVRPHGAVVPVNRTGGASTTSGDSPACSRVIMATWVALAVLADRGDALLTLHGGAAPFPVQQPVDRPDRRGEVTHLRRHPQGPESVRAGLARRGPEVGRHLVRVQLSGLAVGVGEVLDDQLPVE